MYFCRDCNGVSQVAAGRDDTLHVKERNAREVTMTPMNSFVSIKKNNNNNGVLAQPTPAWYDEGRQLNVITIVVEITIKC